MRRPTGNERQGVVDDLEARTGVEGQVLLSCRFQVTGKPVRVGTSERWLQESGPQPATLGFGAHAHCLEVPVGLDRMRPFRVGSELHEARKDRGAACRIERKAGAALSFRVKLQG